MAHSFRNLKILNITFFTYLVAFSLMIILSSRLMFADGCANLWSMLEYRNLPSDIARHYAITLTRAIPLLMINIFNVKNVAAIELGYSFNSAIVPALLYIAMYMFLTIKKKGHLFLFPILNLLCVGYANSAFLVSETILGFALFWLIFFMIKFSSTKKDYFFLILFSIFSSRVYEGFFPYFLLFIVMSLKEKPSFKLTRVALGFIYLFSFIFGLWMVVFTEHEIRHVFALDMIQDSWNVLFTPFMLTGTIPALILLFSPFVRKKVFFRCVKPIAIVLVLLLNVLLYLGFFTHYYGKFSHLSYIARFYTLVTPILFMMFLNFYVLKKENYLNFFTTYLKLKNIVVIMLAFLILHEVNITVNWNLFKETVLLLSDKKPGLAAIHVALEKLDSNEQVEDFYSYNSNWNIAQMSSIIQLITRGHINSIIYFEKDQEKDTWLPRTLKMRKKFGYNFSIFSDQN